MIELTGVPFSKKDDMTKQRPHADDKREQITRWLADYGYTVLPIVREGLKWGLAGNRADDPGIGVGMLKAHTDRVVFQVTYLLEDGFRDRIALLDPENRRQFILDVRLLLISLEAQFSGVDEPLTAVNFAVVVFNEALSRQRVVDTIYRIHRGYAGLSWFLQRRFSDVELDLRMDTIGSSLIN